MYLSPLLIVAVANELATLRCVHLTVSASQERKQRGTDFVRDTVEVHFHLADVRTGSALQEAVSANIPDSDRPRENVDADNEFRALCVNGRRSLGIQCSCACQRLLRFCTSSRFGKFLSVSSLGFVALLATVQALCSLISQVLELYRLEGLLLLLLSTHMCEAFLRLPGR